MSDVLLGEFSTDVTPPALTNPSPTGIDVPRASNVEFDLTDTETGVDLTNTTLTVGGVLVYDWDGIGVPADGFQNSWTGSVADMGGGVWHVTATPPAILTGYTLYAVEVTSQDLAPLPNIMSPYLWSFTTEDDEAPYVDVGYAPTGTGVPTATLVTFDIKDDGIGVDLTEVIVSVGGVLAYDWDGVGAPGDGFQAGFSGSVVAVSPPNHYQFSIDKAPDYDEWTTYLVEIDARDLR